MVEVSAILRRPSLRLNAVSNWVTMGFDIVLGLVLTPFIISHVGTTGYGIWTLAGSFLGYYGLLNIGVESAMTRYVARYAAQRDEDSLNKTVSTAMTMFCCTGLVVVMLSILLAGPLARFFHVESARVADFRSVVIVLGLATGIGFPGNVLGAIVMAHEHYLSANGVHVVVGVVRAALTVVLLLHGLGLRGVAFATLASQLVAMAANSALVGRVAPNIRIRPGLAKLSTLRMLIVYGGVTTVITVADIMRVNLDSVVIGKWVGLSAVGIYGVAALIKKYVYRLVTRGMGVLGPRFAALEGAGEHAKIRLLLEKSLAVAGFLSFGGCVMTVVFGGHFIRLWVGDGFEQAVVVLRLLSICTAVAVAQNPAIVFMYAVNKHYWYAAVTMVEAIANLVLSIVLVFKYGMVGVALGTMIPMLIVKVLVMPVYVSRLAGLRIRDYVRPLLPSAVVAAIVVLGAVHLGVATGETPSVGFLLVSGLATGGLYAAMSYFLIVRRYGRIL